MSSRRHWDRIYTERDPQEVSWYQPHLARSLELIEATGLGPDARVVDVGGGASTLVDDLVERGFERITVVDLSAEALETAKERLGPRARELRWIVGDVLDLDLGRGAFDLWHDRAVFHFLTEEAQRKRYVERLCRALRIGGHVILATFSPEGPEKCSGLPVARYSSEELQATLGSSFELLRKQREEHETPAGKTQSFVYCLCRKSDDCVGP